MQTLHIRTWTDKRHLVTVHGGLNHARIRGSGYGVDLEQGGGCPLVTCQHSAILRGALRFLEARCSDLTDLISASWQTGTTADDFTKQHLDIVAFYSCWVDLQSCRPLRQPVQPIVCLVRPRHVIPPPYGLKCNLLSSLLSILLHTCLHPLASLRRLFLHLGLVLEQLLDCVRARYVTALLDTRTRSETLLPRLECREVINLDACPASSSDPTPVCDI
jgi:hypothetical protein